MIYLITGFCIYDSDQEVLDPTNHLSGIIHTSNDGKLSGNIERFNQIFRLENIIIIKDHQISFTLCEHNGFHGICVLKKSKNSNIVWEGFCKTLNSKESLIKCYVLDTILLQKSK
ncbi:MAG: hypothetical protein PHH83_04505 [Patescibacteria group bacterium]|nr:hypothetical protein [Patescibacteria group bacterium]